MLSYIRSLLNSILNNDADQKPIFPQHIAKINFKSNESIAEYFLERSRKLIIERKKGDNYWSLPDFFYDAIKSDSTNVAVYGTDAQKNTYISYLEEAMNKTEKNHPDVYARFEKLLDYFRSIAFPKTNSPRLTY